VDPKQFIFAAIISSDSPIPRKRLDLSFSKKFFESTTTPSREWRIHIIIFKHLNLHATLPRAEAGSNNLRDGPIADARRLARNAVG
jgi:hypothetical protein